MTQNNTLTTPNKLGIMVSLGIANASSIIGNTIPLFSSWDLHDIIIMVLCLSDIVTILILPILRKLQSSSCSTNKE